MQYSAKYFYNKFEAIPEEMWVTSPDIVQFKRGEKCALYHAGMKWETAYNRGYAPEADALCDLLAGDKFEPERFHIVYAINDGNGAFGKLGQTPRQRILAALRQKMLEGASIK